MAVAVPCTSFGFAIDPSGNLTLAGPRSLAWPNESTCSIAGNNGLHYDPGTGKLWTYPPDTVQIETVNTANNGDIDMNAGTTGSNHQLGNFSIEQTSRICTPSLWTCNGVNNYVHFKMVNDNHWRLMRTTSLYYNGAGIGTVTDSVAELENHQESQIIGIGTAPPAMYYQVPMDNGDTIKLVVSFELEVIQHTDSSYNNNEFRMRWPTLHGVMWSHA